MSITEFNSFFSQNTLKVLTKENSRNIKPYGLIKVNNDMRFYVGIEKNKIDKSQIRVDFSARPLFYSDSVLYLNPGGDLSSFDKNSNSWWEFGSEISSEKSRREIDLLELISKLFLPI